MLSLVLLTLAAAVTADPQATVDPQLLMDIFGTPPPPASTATPDRGSANLEDITIRPTTAGTVYKGPDGEGCQCVPYYLCDSNKRFTRNSSIDGFGTLDIRFGEDECQESVEVCCINPKQPEEVPIPAPDPSRLKGCGYRNPNGLDFTITGGNGHEAQFGEFPWVVALLDANKGDNIGVGVLIHPQVVMTGAHIAFQYAPGGIRARAGEWDTQTTKERLQHQERLVSEIVVREDFNRKNLKNDMALLRLDEPFQLADHINVICLPHKTELFDNSENCVANGWGKDNFGKEGRYAVILKKIEVNIVNHARCNSLLKKTRLGPHFHLDSSFICAGGEEGKDTCKGDGGAPLACPVGDNRYKLAGLVAWGIGCGQKDVPAVYVKVSKFRKWIDQIVTNWGYSMDGYDI